MSCAHPIALIHPTLGSKGFVCRSCRTHLSGDELLRPMQAVSQRVARIELFLANELNAESCERCGEWGRGGSWACLDVGSFCPECLYAETMNPDSALSDSLCEWLDGDDSVAVVLDLREHLSEELLSNWARWRRTYNLLAEHWPAIFPGYCAASADEAKENPCPS